MSVAQFIETRDSLISHSSFSLEFIYNQRLMGVLLRSVSAGDSIRCPSNGIYQADCHNGATYTRLWVTLTDGGNWGKLNQWQECGADCKIVCLVCSVTKSIRNSLWPRQSQEITQGMMKKSYMHINFTFMRMHTYIPYLDQYIPVHKSTAMFELWIHIYVFYEQQWKIKAAVKAQFF